MTAAVTIMQATDWSKYSFEEWCRQLGAWINGDNETMVMVVKTMPTKRITQQQRERLLAMYMSDETLRDRLCVRRKGTCCQLDCNEARAIQRLFLDIQLVEDVILQEWISSIWSHYVIGNSLFSCNSIIELLEYDLCSLFARSKSTTIVFSFFLLKKKGARI